MTTPLPVGTVTFLFSDLEGSSRLWERHPDAMKGTLARHDALLRNAVETNGGHIVKTTGDGCHAVFAATMNGLRAALAAQQALVAEAWTAIHPHRLNVRMGLHTGEAEPRAGDYYGTSVNRAARVMAAAHGGQALVSAATALLVRDDLPDGVTLLDLGEHRLKDLSRPERIYQLAHPTLPVHFPPIHSLDAYPNNLPIQLTSFIGRARELAEARDLLGGTRLLTMTGSGGTGKTRLSLQLASELLPSFADGAWLVELAPLDSADRIVQVVAAVFDLRDVPGVPLHTTVTDYLRAKRLLLLLDNAEHLINPTAQLVDHLLHHCPNVKIIVSSREGLGISGEVSYHVPSLSLPDAGTPTPESLLPCEAVQLFAERAIAVNARFSVTTTNAPAVAQVCQRLDGIPLALELAAARVKVFSAEQIAARLNDSFRLLTGGSRTALPRQQTLRAMIDWSYDLLSEPEQALLRQLSVFAGGWTFEAAEAVCADLDVLELLPQLVNKSLVLADEPQGQVRYRLLETIRQYARDRLLEAGESAAVRNRHLDYFLILSREAEDGMRGTAAYAWYERLQPEIDNLQAATDWAQEARPEDSLFLATNYIYRLGPFLISAQHKIEWLKMMVERVRSLSPVEGAAANYRQYVMARALTQLGAFELAIGNHRLTAQWAGEAVLLARDGGDKFLLFNAVQIAMVGSRFAGDTSSVRAYVEETCGLIEEMGDDLWRVVALLMLLNLANLDGDQAARKRIHEEARQWTKKPSHPAFWTVFLGLGEDARGLRDFDLARSYYEAGAAIASRMKNRLGVVGMQSNLVHIAREQGRLQEARAGYRQTIVFWHNLGHRAAVAHQLESIAFLERADGRYTRAARLLGAAEALRGMLHQPMTAQERLEYEREVAALQQQLTATEFAARWADGRAMSIERAIAYAIEQDGAE